MVTKRRNFLIALALASLLLSGVLFSASSLTVARRADTSLLRAEVRRFAAQPAVPNDEALRRLRAAADLVDVQTTLSTAALELADTSARWLALLSAAQIWLLLRDRRSKPSQGAG